MIRRLLVPLLALAAAAPASAQGLTSLFATGKGDSDPANLTLSHHHLSSSPAVLALTQFTVIGVNPASAVVTSLSDGVVLPLAAISPANPFYLPLTGGGYAFGGGNYPASVLPSFPLLNTSGATPSGPVPTLSVSLTLPTDAKAGILSYTASDADGGLVGGATLPIPVGGWWVLGFGSEGDPLPPEQLPDGPVFTTGGPNNGPQHVPEPATLLLAGVGLAGAAAMRKRCKRVD